jgi:hypothetical protein
MIRDKKANIGSPLVYALLLIFILLFITVAGNYYLNAGKLDEETNEELIEALEQETYVETEQDTTVINKVLEWFGNEEDEDEETTTSGTLEERLYSEQNEKQVNLEGTYGMIKKAPTIIGVTIFGFSASSVFITFLISCIVIYLAWVSYKELKSFFGRS